MAKRTSLFRVASVLCTALSASACVQYKDITELNPTGTAAELAKNPQQNKVIGSVEVHFADGSYKCDLTVFYDNYDCQNRYTGVHIVSGGTNAKAYEATQHDVLGVVGQGLGAAGSAIGAGLVNRIASDLNGGTSSASSAAAAAAPVAQPARSRSVSSPNSGPTIVESGATYSPTNSYTRLYADNGSAIANGGGTATGITSITPSP